MLTLLVGNKCNLVTKYICNLCDIITHGENVKRSIYCCKIKLNVEQLGKTILQRSLYFCYNLDMSASGFFVYVSCSCLLR